MLSKLISSAPLCELSELLLTPAGAAAYEVGEGLKAALAAALAEKTGRQVLYVAPGSREAARIAEDVMQYLPAGAGTLAPRERQFVRAAMSHEGEWQRLHTLSRLRTGEMRVLCIAPDALLWRLTPPSLYDEMTVTISVGDVIEPRALIEKLTAAGFEHVDMVEGKGQCALRGAIVDVFPPCETNALRIEFFDDEVDGMRTFDCISQRSVEYLDTARISPAAEYLLKAEDRPAAGERMRKAVENAIRQVEQTKQQTGIQHVTGEHGETDAAPQYLLQDGLKALLLEVEKLESGALCRPMDLWAHVLLPNFLKHNRSRWCLLPTVPTA